MALKKLGTAQLVTINVRSVLVALGADPGERRRALGARPMSGSGMMLGGAYQAGVIAWLYVHVLREQRLHWFELADDRPLAVAGEVSGPGDDVRIEFPAGVPSVEVQAKHGLSGKLRLREVLRRISETPSTTTGPIVLAVDRTSSSWIHKILPDDLECLRQDREDAIRQETREFIESLDTVELQVLPMLYVKILDLDEPEDPDAKWAISALQDLLEDANCAELVWKLLRDDATTVCKRRLSRTASDLRELLDANGLRVRPPLPQEKINHELDASKALLKQHKPIAVLSLLSEIEQQFADCPPDAIRRYRFFQHRATAYLQLGRLNEALDAAQIALKHDPDGIHALVIASGAAIALARLDLAQQWADHAALKHPNEPDAWILKADVASAMGEAPTLPSQAILSSPKYRTGICNILLREGRTSEVLDVTAGLLEEGARTPEVLVLRSRALVTNDWGDVGVYAPEVAREVDVLTSEVIAGDPSDDILRDAHAVRSVARRSLGRQADADADIRRAYELQPTDPAALLRSAQVDLNAGRYEAAYRTLSTPLAEEYPILLAIRAAALANLSRASLAAEDIGRALKNLAKAWEPDAVRLACADAAVQMEDVVRAEQALTGLSGAATKSSRYAIVRGRMAFMKADAKAGREWFEKAATRDNQMRSGILAELGCRLLAAEQPTEAVAAFDAAEDMPSKVLPMYVRALTRSNRMAKADEVVQEALSGEKMPDWALDAAVQIAILRDDLEGGVKYLKMLLERPGVTYEARLELIRLLVRLRRRQEAHEEVKALTAEVDQLDGRQHMALAQAVHLLGNTEEGLRLAFMAYRKNDDDPELHRALAGLALQSAGSETTVNVIGPDCYAKLVAVDEDRTIDYTILSSTPVRARDRQILVETAEKLGLMGLRVGDTITLEESWGTGRWRVDEIKTAVGHVVQDILVNYSDRFPTEDFFVKGFSVVENGGVADFAPIIGSLGEKGRHRTEILKLYAEQVLPLGFVANATGHRMDEVMLHLSTTAGAPMVFVEWADVEGQQQSLAAVAAAKRVVLTESALWTAHRIGLLDRLAKRFELVVPRAVLEELQNRLDELDKRVQVGHRVVSDSGPGLELHEWGPGDAVLVSERDSFGECVAWLEKHACPVPRPAEGVTTDDGAERNERVVGRSSSCAAELGIYGETVYADDLGLRRIILASGGRSFSTVTLIRSLMEEGLMSRDEFSGHLLWLAEHRYFAVPMSEELICRAFRDRVPSSLLGPLSVAASATAELDGAAKAGASALKRMATGLGGVSLGVGTGVIVAAMSAKWGRDAAGRALARAAMEQFVLLPRQLAAIIEACRREGK